MARRTSASFRNRAQNAPTMNTLQPSAALISWIDRTVQKITAEPPWVYQNDTPAAVREQSSAPRPAAAPTPRAQMVNRTRESVPAIPDDIRERFVRVGRDFYFPHGTRAFRDLGKKVTTQSENIEVVRSLVRIAQERGWKDITVTGSERFRREAWRAGTYVGLVVRGYRPTAVEKRQFVREIAQLREPQQPLIDPVPLVEPSPRASLDAAHRRQPPLPSSMDVDAPTQTPSPMDTRRELERAKAPERRATPRERVYEGTLLEHGSARYEFKDEGENSYFVKIDTKDGPKVLWGLDMERALAESGVQPGDPVQARVTGRKKVTVRQLEKDETGRVVGEHLIATHRNQWDVRRPVDTMEPDGYESSREQIPRDDRKGTRTDARLAVRAAELFADERIPNEKTRGEFVHAVREQLTHVQDQNTNGPMPPLRQQVSEQVPPATPSLG